MPHFTLRYGISFDFGQSRCAGRGENRLMRWLACLALMLPLGANAEPPDFAVLVSEQAASVVSIAAAYATPPVLPDIPVDEALRDLMERVAAGVRPDFDPAALGTGFIVSSDGYIVTAYHVIEDAVDDEVIVRLADGRQLPGRVVGMDRVTDIGLVKVTASGLPQVRIGEPARLQPGAWVVAIGTPFGFDRSVAAGVVSTTARTIPSETHIPFIQSDAALNPGHSGGPLFNLGGEVVGVNSMIYTFSGGSMGLSFAVPIDVAMKTVEQLRLHGAVSRGRIGIKVQEVTVELSQAFRVERAAGALITAVEKEAPAQRAGLRSGDIVTSFGGKQVQSHADLLALVADSVPGSAVPVDFVRDGIKLEATVRVAAQRDARPRLSDPGGTDRLGFKLAPVPEAQRRRLGIESGLLVQRAEGAARRAGLVAGDIVISVNARPLAGLEAFRGAVGNARPGETLALLVERGGTRAFVPLRVP
jgi:serine protease Do